MSEPTWIMVRLTDEAVDVWRPVRAEQMHTNVYRIANESDDPDLETWEFVPGDIVECEWVVSDEGTMLAAVRQWIGRGNPAPEDAQ